AVAHTEACALHGGDVGVDIGREVDLVDDQKVAADDSGAALARDVIAVGDVDHEQPVIDALEREGRSQIVAAAFDEHEIEPGKGQAQPFYGLAIEGRVL